MITIGISGPSGSGKTFLCKKLSRHLANCRIIQQDWYFIDPDECEDDANYCDLRYLHVREFVGHFSLLQTGNVAAVPVVDFETFHRTGERNLIEPGDFLLVEGMTIFRIPEILRGCDLHYYLAPDMEIVRKRKWARDLSERNKSPEIIEGQLEWIEREYRWDLAWLPACVQIMEFERPETMESMHETILSEIMQKSASELETEKDPPQ